MSDPKTAPKPQPTRREAATVAAGAAATVAAASLVGGAPWIQKVKGANNQIQYGFIGTGSRGQYLLGHLKGIDNGRCVAVCDNWDVNLDKGAAKIGGSPKKYKDYRELLADKNVEAVMIATPLYMHYPATRDALLAGKHVFCEKSLVFKPEEVHALRALSEQYPRQVLQVGLQRRYSKFYQTAREMVEKGLLGTVTHIRSQWHRNTFAKDPWNKPIPQGRTDEETNWRKYRRFSGGLMAELASHQIDIADWMFGATPEFVVGVGGTDYIKDGRDIFDNVQLIYKYPKGQKLQASYITTNRHLPLFNAERTEFGECIMGTQGTIHITVGTDDEPSLGMWFQEPAAPTTGGANPAQKASSSLASTGKGGKGIPILFERDKVTNQESFLEREMKYARLWLYKKGVMVPTEDRNPVDVSLESFLNDARTGGKPRANLEIGLQDSIAVMLSNLSMYEERRVYFNEIEKMGRSGVAPAKAVPAAAGKKA
jgi:predicted dehydrogenase